MEQKNNLQMKKEAMISVGLYVAFFAWWYFTGYGIAERGTPETYTYILGLPMWFFLSSIVGYLLFCIATVVAVKCFFKDFDLTVYDEVKEERASNLEPQKEDIGDKKA